MRNTDVSVLHEVLTVHQLPPVSAHSLYHNTTIYA